MLEIDELVPVYICNRERNCHYMNKFCCDEHCSHTFYPGNAKNKESIELFIKFCETFNVVVDDYGRLICTERINKDE